MNEIKGIKKERYNINGDFEINNIEQFNPSIKKLLALGVMR